MFATRQDVVEEAPEKEDVQRFADRLVFVKNLGCNPASGWARSGQILLRVRYATLPEVRDLHNVLVPTRDLFDQEAARLDIAMEEAIPVKVSQSRSGLKQDALGFQRVQYSFDLIRTLDITVLTESWLFGIWFIQILDRAEAKFCGDVPE